MASPIGGSGTLRVIARTSCPSARTADTMACPRVDPRVRFIEGMAVFARSLRSIASRKRVPSHDVVFSGGGAQMSRIAASPMRAARAALTNQRIVADVVKGEPRWDWTDAEFVGEPMCAVRSPVQREAAVSTVQVPVERPTGIGSTDLNPSPESFLDADVSRGTDGFERVAVFSPALVMATTPAPCLGRGRASVDDAHDGRIP